MSTPAIKTKFEISGEKEYKAALTEINSGLRVLSSEMKLTKSQYDGSADSMEALNAKADVLSRQIVSQKEKVEKLREALQHSVEVYGENDVHTNKWRVSLNSAETELNQMSGELGRTETAMKQYNISTDSSAASGKGLGDVVDGLTTRFGVDLPDGLKTSMNGMLTLNTGVLAVVAALAAMAAGAAKGMDALIDLTDQAAAGADDIMTLSLQTGLATDTIQELKYAAELIDVPFETLQSSMARMIRNMSTAKSGTGAAAEAFKALGVSVTDQNGNLRDSEEVFNQVIDALHNMSSETDRDADAMAIFGRSAQDLNPLIVQGSDVLAKYRREAEDTGYVLSTDALQALGAVDDAHQRLINTQTEAKNKLALVFAPALKDFYAEATEGWDEMSGDIRDSGLVDVAASLLDCVTALGPAFSELGDILKDLEPAFDLVAIALGAVADLIRVIGDGLAALLHLLDGTSGTYLSDAWSVINGSNSSSASAMERINARHNASGDANYPGGLTWVGENGPEPVWLPRGSGIGTAQDGRRLGGGDMYNITIDAKNVREFNDIVRLARDARVTARMSGDKT